MYELSPQDRILLEKAETLFPGRRITERFNKCAAIPAEDRYEYTLNEMKNLPRQGLIRIGLTSVQSLYSHTQNMMKLAHNEGERKMAEGHDMPEGLTTDFCHIDVGTKERKRTKIRLENLAARIIFEGRPENYKLWHEYEDRRTPRSHKIKDIDMLEWKKTCDLMSQIFVYTPQIRDSIEIFQKKAAKVCEKRDINESAYNTDVVTIENYRHQDGDRFKTTTLPNLHGEESPTAPQP